MSDQFESQLRDGLARRAEYVNGDDARGSRTVVNAATANTARRHRRRMAATSVAAAAALTTGLVVISRHGRDGVATNIGLGSAGAPAATAGSATGSSTGSATGSPTGWTQDYGAADGKWLFGSSIESTSVLPHVSLAPGDGYTLASFMTHGVKQSSLLAAADLAVAAQIDAATPLRFVVASVQDSSRLQAGRGGEETTIAGRHARIISRRAATTMTFDVSDTKRALVYYAGVDDSTVASWLATLAPNAGGQWEFSKPEAPGGLWVVPTTTPTQQVSRSQTWEHAPAGGDGCPDAGYTLDVTSGSAYEFWARLADEVRWDTALPAVRSIQMPWGGGPALAVESPATSSLTALMGDVVVQISRWTTDRNQAAAAPSIDPALMTMPSDAQWAALLNVGSANPLRCIKERQGPVIVPAEPATTTPAPR